MLTERFNESLKKKEKKVPLTGLARPLKNRAAVGVFRHKHKRDVQDGNVLLCDNCRDNCAAMRGYRDITGLILNRGFLLILERK